MAEKPHPVTQLWALKKVLAERSLYEFVKMMWFTVEPATMMVDGKVVEVICQHLEATLWSDDPALRRLIINVPPGCMKSLLCNVFFPCWVWGPQALPSTRFISFSYSAHLTERDNERCLQVMQSGLYKKLWGDKFKITKTGVTKIGNSRTGWKLATSVGGVGTGERADYLLIDDANNVKETESKPVREGTNLWLTEVIPTRLSSPELSRIINIQQRTHESDATGTLLEVWGDYTHLMLPMEYDPTRHCETGIGFSDWRQFEGELLWPARFPVEVVEDYRRTMGPYAFAGQLQQAPTARGGGLIKREWWQEWEYAESPPAEFVLASLDTSVKEREENDYYAMTVLAVWRDPESGVPKVFLLYAWHERATLPEIVQRVVATCQKLKVDQLVIEDKSHGWIAQQEIMKQTSGWKFGVTMFDPRRYGDKTARLLSVQHLFSERLVYAPVAEDADGFVTWRKWASLVIDEVCNFPRAKHDDLCDAFVMGLRHLRDVGFALNSKEHHEDEQLVMHRPRQQKALYPV